MSGGCCFELFDVRNLQDLSIDPKSLPSNPNGTGHECPAHTSLAHTSLADTDLAYTALRPESGLVGFD